jgi:hypothetical protein
LVAWLNGEQAGVTSHDDLDWRLTVRFESREHAHGIFSALKTHGSAALAASRLRDGVVAEHDEDWLRIYAASLDALRRGQAIVASVIELEGVQVKEQAEHRAAEGAEWASVELPPPPERDADLVSEHHGKGPWGSEVAADRVQAHFELASKHEAKAFAGELADDGYDVHQAESFVFLFADDGAAARKLGSELQKRAPADAQLFYEGDGRTLFV